MPTPAYRDIDEMTEEKLENEFGECHAGTSTIRPPVASLDLETFFSPLPEMEKPTNNKPSDKPLIASLIDFWA